MKKQFSSLDYVPCEGPDTRKFATKSRRSPTVFYGRPKKKPGSVAGFRFIGRFSPRLPSDPLVFAPISAALALTPLILVARTPFPVILVNSHAGLWRVSMLFFYVPAHVPATHDCRGRACQGQSQ